MSFARPSVRRPPTPRTGAVVHAVGQRVYVAGSANGPAHVELMDDGGKTAVAKLVDGAEVMIVAWRPRGSTGTRYCVRSTRDGLEGWLAAANLRRSRVATPSPAAPAPPTVSAAPSTPARRPDSKARFGGR